MGKSDNSFKYTLRNDLIDTDKSLYRILYDSAIRHRDVIALELGETRITYGRLIDEIDRAACMFKSAGINTNTVVAICHNGLPATIISIYALSKIGAKASLIRANANKHTFAELATKTNCKYALMSCDNFNQYYETFSNTPVKTVIISQFKDYFDLFELRKKFMLKARRNDKLRYARGLVSDINILMWDKLLKEVPDDYRKQITEVEHSLDETAIYNHFGSAKCDRGTVEISERAINNKLLSFSSFFKGSNNGEQYRILCLVDKAFIYGLLFGIHTPLVMGHTITMCNSSTDVLPIPEINYYKPDVLIGYPSVINRIIDNSGVNTEALMNLKKVFSGGDLFSGILQSKFHNAFEDADSNVELYQFYGVTETMSVVSCNYPELMNDRTIGIAIPGTKIMICNPVTMKEMPVGQTGEIFVLTNSCVNGYLDNAEATSKLIRNHPDGRKWIMTGDMGHCDDKGLLYFDGSSKRCYEIDGMQVFPKIVEDEIRNIYGVEECAVVVNTDENDHRELIAVIVPREDLLFDNDRMSSLKNSVELSCQMMFSGAMVPGDIEFRAYLPKLTNNSVDIQALTASVIENRNKQ